MTRDDKWKSRVLDYDPQAGDKDRDGVRIIRDCIVVSRKRVQCADCKHETVPGTLIRSMTAVIDGERVVTARSCQECCDYMAAFVESEQAT